MRAYVRTGVRAEEATWLLYVRTSRMLHCIHLLLLLIVTNYIWNYNIRDSHTYHDMSDTPRSEDIVYIK